MTLLTLHYDTPHAHGGALKDALQRSFGAAWRELPAKTRDRRGWSEADLREFIAKHPGVRAISSTSLVPRLPDGLAIFPVALLRHPLDRLLAIFESWRDGAGAPAGCDLSTGLPGFCAWVLGRSAETLPLRNGQCLRFSALAWEKGPTAAATPMDLAAAKAFLTLMPAVAIADRLDHSLQALIASTPEKAGIAWPPPGDGAARAHQSLLERLTRFSAALDPVTYHAICEENSLDLALYEFCCAFLTARTPRQPVDALLFSGERFIPNDAGFGVETAAEHLLRYRSVTGIVTGKRVLDVACGEGYGTALLSGAALSADGVDNSLAAVQHAQARYSALGNCRFHLGDATALPFPDAHFDVAVSFETIEHIDGPTQLRFVAELRRVLKPDGILVISSPNRRNYSERKGIHNPFHLRELDESELRELLSPFRMFSFYRQGMMAFAAIWGDEGEAYRLTEPLRANGVDDIYFLAVCGREEATAPAASLNSLSYEPQLSYVVLQDTLAEKELTISSASSWAQGLDQTCAKLQAELDQVSARCIEMGEWGQRLQKTVEARDLTIRELTSKLGEISTWGKQTSEQHEAQLALIQERESLVSGLSERLSGLLAARQEEQARRAQAEETFKERIAWGQQEHARRKELEVALNERERQLSESRTAQEALRQDLRERAGEIGRLTSRCDSLAHSSAAADARWSAAAEAARAHSAEATRLQEDLRLKEAEVRAQGLELQAIILQARNLTGEREELQRLNRAASAERAAMAEHLHDFERMAAIQLQAKEAQLRALGQESQARALEVEDLTAERDELRRRERAAAVERAALSDRLHELERKAADLLQAKESKEAEMSVQVAGLLELINAADKRLSDALEALASHELHAADIAAQFTAVFSQMQIPLATAAATPLPPAMESRTLRDMKVLVGTCQAELQRLTSDAVRLRAENASFAQDLRRIQGGHCYRVIAAYWRVRDRVIPAGTARRALAKSALAVVRHPWLGARTLAVGDLGWLGHGLDGAWHAQRARERPYEPRTWSMRLFPLASRQRMLLDMLGASLRHPFRLLLGHPTKKWGTAVRLLMKGQVAEMWMRFQQVRGEALRRHPPAPQTPIQMPVAARPMPVLDAAAAPTAPMDGEAPILTLPPAPSPEVTIVIPAHDHWDLTLACLQSLAGTPSAVSFEVILADDASGDATAAQAQRVANLRVVRNAENLGFLRTCNRAAGLARGRWICLLNNDTQVTAAWLDELVATVRSDARIGAVGAKLVYPDGRLQEAGSLVWSDGTATNWGMHGDPDAPPFAHARAVDYCSAACLLVDAALFQRLGGFDERYVPAFYEDTDLAFRIRAAGRTTLYQPRAAVFHHGGASCGDAPGRGIKDHQERNRAIFAARWADVLRHHHAPGSPSTTGTGRAKPVRRMLVIDQFLPTPDRDAGSVFISEFMVAFRALGYHVSFIGTKVGSASTPEAHALQRAGIEVLALPHVRDARTLLAEQGGSFTVIAMVRHHIAHEVLGDVTCHAPHAKRIFIPADLHWLRSSREADVNDDSEARSRAKREQAEELAIVSACAATVIHSSHERSLLLAASPKSLVELLPWIVRPPARVPPLAGRRGVAFVGSFAHRPNVDAAIFLATAVWPQVRARFPGAALSIVGAAPPPQVEALAGSGIAVLGHVPDLTAFLGGVRATVAPLRWGAGFKGKVAVSVAHGVPVVVTPVAAEGMGLSAAEIALGESAEELADALIALLSDDARWERMSVACLAYARARWTPEAAQSQLIGLLSRLAVWPTEEISDGVQAQANKVSGEPAHV